MHIYVYMYDRDANLLSDANWKQVYKYILMQSCILINRYVYEDKQKKYRVRFLNELSPYALDILLNLFSNFLYPFLLFNLFVLFSESKLLKCYLESKVNLVKKRWSSLRAC